ncbi:hypothetical protein RBH26_19450 [Natronolimnohabitans sp. A-GB9]|uniref:hypothetical protein n=1 Tax=Natronolimnohabitans sp. A-GB9 TaxID=3069757 RepID=UPI0027AFEE47|nr:hypothetical protein [Natronolimnohabitans sp. A-GB9]MDQ2052638.1 hypothetical protein [Natronolimnohabitans sp. A-GB9]
MNREELFLAIIAYTLVAWVLTSEGAFWFAWLPLYVLVIAIPIYVVVDLVRNPDFE